MCGIIAFIAKDNKQPGVGKEIIEQYQRQHGRGTRGFGSINVAAKGYTIDRATEPVKALMDARFSDTPIQIFHHRMPTSTDNELEQTHPFHISHDTLDHDYLVIHNGVIRNDDELLKHHTEELGYVYKTLQKSSSYNSYPYASVSQKFNDSEALAIEVARFFDGETSIIDALGTIAFIALKLNKETQAPIQMIWGRNNGNPLEVVETESGLLIASEIYHADAETVTENTYEVLDLKKYFAAKKAHKSIVAHTVIGDVAFKVPAVVTPTTTSNMGFGQSRTPSLAAGKTSVDIEAENDDMDDFENGYQTPREAAFERMGQRFAANMEDEIMEFFANLALHDVDDETVMELASHFCDELLEKVEIVRDKVRPYYDKLETEEYDEIMAGIEQDELSLNERLEEHDARYSQIIA